MAKVSFREERCKGCGLCVGVCPKKILEMSKTSYNDKGFRVARCVDQSACIGCAFCGTMCPDAVITVEK
ncbi:2-oxoacid:acceptor oxidoreductase subunit delta [Clostridia bacterium]|nr:2-oxoacid:acceptor oxidoreductase subunit delta [Clostridia bacterium]